MKVTVAGIGACGPGFDNWEELKARLQAGDGETLPATARPKPGLIPPRERRRAPLAVKLAVEVADQACRAAGTAPQDAACVFGSGMGDMDITHALCETLATDDKLVSPTQFHNSVHNAPAGYWTISTGCRQPANSVCAFRHTAAMTLLESAAQCVAEQQCILMVLHDIAAPALFHDILPVTDSFAAALMLHPAAGGRELELRSGAGTAEPPASPLASLDRLQASNPSAGLLPLLAMMACDKPDSLTMPLSDHAMLRLCLS